MITTRQVIAYNYLYKSGYSVSGACAAIGNMVGEVGPNLTSGFSKVTDHGSQGVCQWRLDRLVGKDGLEVYCKDHNLDAELLISQLDFMMWEIQKFYPALDRVLRFEGDVHSQTKYFMDEYERPAVATSHLDTIRRPYAQLLYNRVHASPPKKDSKMSMIISYIMSRLAEKSTIAGLVTSIFAALHLTAPAALQGEITNIILALVGIIAMVLPTSH
jgi:hypothetical protein